jgi:glycerophosphoryl diester phosphodiesterase
VPNRRITRPLLLGHRGTRASCEIPENTIDSFELCLKHGCDGFEFDVRLSGDGQAVICHDAAYGGHQIARTAAASLQLPILDDVLNQFTDRAFLDIELKVVGLESSTLASLLKYPPRNGFVISSFLPQVLATIRDLDYHIPLGFLCETQRQHHGWHGSSAEWVIPRCDLANAQLIQEVHGAGKQIMLWTVNRADRMQEFGEWGADAIISDDTKLLVESFANGK